MFLHIGIDRSFNVLQSKMLSADIEYDGCFGEGKTIFVWKKSGKIKEFQVSSLMKTLHMKNFPRERKNKHLST